MSIRRILALALKELQDLRRNNSIISMLLVAPLMTWLYSKLLRMPPHMAFTIGSLFAVVMIGVYTPAMMFAEEKEKHTLRVLMLSPATASEILISKGLITYLAVMLLSLALIPIAGVTVANPLLLFVILSLGSIFVIALGFSIGLFSPNQMATGYIGMPIYLVLLLVPLLGQVNPSLRKLASFVPSNYIGDGVIKALEGQSLAAAGNECALLILASAVVLAVFVYFYRRNELSA